MKAESPLVGARGGAGTGCGSPTLPAEVGTGEWPAGLYVLSQTPGTTLWF